MSVWTRRLIRANFALLILLLFVTIACLVVLAMAGAQPQ